MNVIARARSIRSAPGASLPMARLRWTARRASRAAISAGVYFCAAKIGLLLAPPVGIASLFWPATGLALALVLRWQAAALAGIAIGAFLAHLSSAPGAVLALPQPAHLVALSVLGAAAALQALAAATMVRVYLTAATEEFRPRRLLMLLTTACGPVAVIRAGIATPVLWHDGLLAGLSPWTFGSVMWLGDIAALLSAMPLVALTGGATGARTRIPQSLRAPVMIMLGLLLCAGLAAAAVTRLIHHTDRADFEEASTLLTQAMAAKAEDDTLLLETLRGLLETDPRLPRAAFAELSASILRARSRIDAIGFVRRVPATERAAFERSRSAELGRPVVVGRLGASGHLEPAPPSDGDLFPMDYAEPAAVLPRVMGFDLSSEPRRAAALQRALETGEPSATAGLKLAGEPSASNAVVTVFPVYAAARAPRPRALLGFVVMTTKLDHWLQALLMGSNAQMQAASIRIDDITGGGRLPLIATADAGGPSTPLTASGFQYRRTIWMEGRRWEVMIGLPLRNASFLADPAHWIGPLFPQLLGAVIAGVMLLVISQVRTRDRHEMQMSALSRRYLSAVGPAPPPAPIHPPLPSSDLEAGCEAIWTAQKYHQCYEPVVDLRDGRLIGFESLLRITGTAAAPRTFDFITWAEQTGRIRALTSRAIGEALRQIERFQISTASTQVPWISVNVSATDLGDDDFIGDLLAQVQAHPASRPRLKLEITESVLLGDIEMTARRLHLLRGTGLRIALDDFGTGYASLSYLRQLPLDTVKIDRSFVSRVTTDDAAREIVTAMIALARRLGLDVIAEGIEDAPTALAIARLGCTQAQGYRFAHASPADVVTGWVRSARRFPVG